MNCRGHFHDPLFNPCYDVLSVDDLQKERDAYEKVKQDYDSTIAELAEM